MKNEITIQARAYIVTVRDERTGEEFADHLVLDKRQLQAAQIVGQSSTELIYRLYNRQGYKVLEIGTPTKKELKVELNALFFGELAQA